MSDVDIQRRTRSARWARASAWASFVGLFWTLGWDPVPLIPMGDSLFGLAQPIVGGVMMAVGAALIHDAIVLRKAGFLWWCLPLILAVVGAGAAALPTVVAALAQLASGEQLASTVVIRLVGAFLVLGVGAVNGLTLILYWRELMADSPSLRARSESDPIL